MLAADATEPSAFSRHLGFLGIGLALFFGVPFVLTPLNMPDANASAATFAEHYADNRTTIIVTSVGAVFSNAALLAFFTGVRELLSVHAPARFLATAGLAGFAVLAGVSSVGFSIFAATAYAMPDPELVRLLSEIGWITIGLGAGPPTVLAAPAFAVALLRTGRGGTWLLPLSLVTAAAHVLGSATFADAGFLSPTGTLAILVPELYFVWIGGVAISLLRSPT